MSLVFQGSKWLKQLWESHVEHSRSAQKLLWEGKAKQKTFPALAQSVHDLLYSRRQPFLVTKPTPPLWATALVEHARLLPEFAQLRARCARNGFLAGVAAECLLRTLIMLLPEPQMSPAHGGPNGQGNPQDQESDQPGEARRALRQGMREALSAVDDASSQMDGMAEALGLRYGTEPGHSETMQGLDAVRTLYNRLKDHRLLRRIAELAGRLQRLASSHRRTTITPGIGNIKGITIGGDLARILPGELAGLRSSHRLTKLATLGKVLERRALQYEMSGQERADKGPIILLCDESGSMAGDKEIWSKAVALTLMATATTQRRAFSIIGFMSDITHEHSVHAGESMNLEACLAVLSHSCAGGTDFNPPLQRGGEIIQDSHEFTKADLLLITDGDGNLSQEVKESINHLRKKTGLYVTCLLIGADTNAKHLRPLADELYQLSASPDRDSAEIVPVLALTH